MAYAVENQHDCAMALFFLTNVAGCAMVLLIALWKRARKAAARAR
jgi:hypothetical protein